MFAVQGEADCMVPIIVYRSKAFSRAGGKKGIIFLHSQQ